jgi:hypothetical protein
MNMWAQIVWRSDLSIAECEQRLGKMPKRTFLITSAKQPVVVARVSGRLFRLFLAGTAMRVLFAPYFYGFLIDKHAGTEIRGRVFPAPPAQVAAFMGIFVTLLLASSLAVTRGVVVSPAMLYGPLALLAICFGVAAASWPSGRTGSALIERSIESAFDARRLTPHAAAGAVDLARRG